MLLTIISGGFIKIAGLLFVSVSVWRITKVWQYRIEIEEVLREHRGEKAELQAMLMARDKFGAGIFL